MTDVDPKQVAKHLDRRQRRRRLIVLSTVLALAILAILYLRCGRGLGGRDEGTGSAQPLATPIPDAAPRTHCALRLAAAGLSLDGESTSSDAAIAACKQATIEVLVTGDARQGDWDKLREALDAASIHYTVREP